MKLSEIIKIALIIYIVLTVILNMICVGIVLFGGKTYTEAMVVVVENSGYIPTMILAAIFAVGCFKFFSASYKLNHESEENPLSNEEKEKLQKTKNGGINLALAILLLIVVSIIVSYSIKTMMPSQARYVNPK